MKSKKNKRGTALVFTIVILSIGAVVALSIAASSVITRKGASSTERANQSFQEIDSASDKFDKIFENVESFVCEVRDYFDDDSSGASRPDLNCPDNKGNTHETIFGKCNPSTGKITSKDGKSETTIFGTDNSGSDYKIGCNEGISMTEVTKTKTVAMDDQNKRAVENVPPCAGFDPDLITTDLIGRWDMDKSGDLIDCTIGTELGKCIKDLSGKGNHMQLMEAHHDTVAAVDSKVPEIGTIGDGKNARTALLINKDNKVEYKNKDAADKIDTSSGKNTKFNWGQIRPIKEYAVTKGTVAFWFYTEVPDTKKYGFTTYSKDTVNCVSDGEYGYVDNNNPASECKSWLNCGRGGDPGAVSDVCADNKLDQYWPFTGYGSGYTDEKYKYSCDCGHMSFMWNAHYWDAKDKNNNTYYPYKDRFGTRFQNDGNGSHYRLRGPEQCGTGGCVTGQIDYDISKAWHLAVITFDGNGARLFYDNRQIAGLDTAADAPMPYGTPDADDNTFEGLKGNYTWAYLGIFGGTMHRNYYNTLNPVNDQGTPTLADDTVNEHYYTNAKRFLEHQLNSSDHFKGEKDSNGVEYYPGVTNNTGGKDCFGEIYNNKYSCTNQMEFYPFKGGIRRLRMYKRAFSECEVRKLKYYTEKD